MGGCWEAVVVVVAATHATATACQTFSCNAVAGESVQDVLEKYRGHDRLTVTIHLPQQSVGAGLCLWCCGVAMNGRLPVAAAAAAVGGVNRRLPGAAADGELTGGNGWLPQAAAAAAVIGRPGPRRFHTGEGTCKTTGIPQGTQGSLITSVEPFFLVNFSRVAETLTSAESWVAIFILRM